MKVIYVSGPIRNDDPDIEKANIASGIEAAREIFRAGAVALCPHMYAYFWGDDDAPASQQTLWLDGDLEMIRRSDAVLALPGWQKSKGATAEIFYCTENGIKVFDSLNEATEWVSLK